MKKVRVSRIDIIQSCAIAILIFLIILNNLSPVRKFLHLVDPFTDYQVQLTSLEKRNRLLEFDRVRLEDASNILLAIQDFYFQNGTIPNSLAELHSEGYIDLGARMSDPETGRPYYFEKRQRNFVFCVRLSDMVKGVNTEDCPLKDQ